MSQPSAELERLRAELVEKKDLVIEAHQKLREERRASYDVKIALRSAEEKLATCREDLGKTLDLLDAQKVKLAKNQAALEVAKRSAAESQAALSKAEESLEEVRADRKAIYESNIELKEQVKSCKSELESERKALSQAEKGRKRFRRLWRSRWSMKPRRSIGPNFLKSSWMVFLLPWTSCDESCLYADCLFCSNPHGDPEAEGP